MIPFRKRQDLTKITPKKKDWPIKFLEALASRAHMLIMFAKRMLHFAKPGMRRWRNLLRSWNKRRIGAH